MSLSKKILSFLHKSNATRLAQKFFPNSLTVLNYHRIDYLENNQDMFQPNISATPPMFEWQMAFIKKWYRVISLQQLTDWLTNKAPMPPHAALITFDDGYADNYTNALPILKKYDLPAVIFLTTGYIASNRPFYWDLASYCFVHTQTDRVQFPDGAEKAWQSVEEKKATLKSWIEAMKKLSENEKQTWVSQLPEALGVSIPHDFFENKMLTWEQIREMRNANIEFGAHTINHPILTRISLTQAREEIIGSKQKIEQELEEPVTSLAYPNGMQTDFNTDIAAIAKEVGLASAFTLLSGPTLNSTAKKNPYTIRRIFISHNHSSAHFSLLASPLNRLRNS
ncbi:MAG: polysaccharide deacetylase family protein [Anaerolineales bacterium]|nr:polysaccharide deacetylase family protein [Anaerolineales bacterium]